MKVKRSKRVEPAKKPRPIGDIEKHKKQKLSWRNKTSWRKVDVTQLEDHIDEQNLQQRLGLDFDSKPDDELFVVDKEPEAAPKLKSSKEKLTLRQRKKLALPKTPKCFQALVNSSKVPDPIRKRNHTKPQTISEVTEQKRIKAGIYVKKLELAKRNRLIASERRENRKKLRTEFTSDLWATDEVATDGKPKKEWFSKDTYLINKTIKPAKPGRKKSKASSVPVPHPGTSYNPSLKDHRDLMNEIVQDELKTIKEEEHLARTTSKIFRSITLEEKNKEELDEMREGLSQFSKENDDETIEEADNIASISINPPVINKKRDARTKRRITREKEKQALFKKQIVEKKKMAQIYKLKAIEKDAETKENTCKERKLKREKRLAENPPLPRISARKFKEPLMVFQQPGELSGNLKNIVPAGNLLEETFASFQRRGLAPISAPITLKKGKKKRFTLPSHRMPWEKIEGPVKSKK